MKLCRSLSAALLALSLSLPYQAFAAATSDPIQPVDVNTADANTLMSVKGIGESKADAIVAYRQQHGDFQSLDDLENIRGIGPKQLEAMSPYLTLEAQK